MNKVHTLKQHLAKAVRKAVSLDGNLDQHATVDRKFWCEMANEILAELEALGEDPAECLEAVKA